MTQTAQKPDARIGGTGIQGAIAFQHQLKMLNEVMAIAVNAAHAIASRQAAAVSSSISTWLCCRLLACRRQ
jgi:hypothetical protein